MSLDPSTSQQVQNSPAAAWHREGYWVTAHIFTLCYQCSAGCSGANSCSASMSPMGWIHTRWHFSHWQAHHTQRAVLSSSRSQHTSWKHFNIAKSHRLPWISGFLNILRKKAKPTRTTTTKRLCAWKNMTTKSLQLQANPSYYLPWWLFRSVSLFSQASDAEHQQTPGSDKMQLVWHPALRRLRPSWWICSHETQKETWIVWGTKFMQSLTRSRIIYWPWK